MEPKWSPRGAQMETKSNEFRRHFATPAQEPSRGGFGKGSGSIFGGFWDGFGGIQEDFWRILNEIWKVFECIFGGFLIETCLLPGAPQATKSTHSRRQNQKKNRILANPSESWRILGILANRRNPRESWRILANPRNRSES